MRRVGELAIERVLDRVLAARAELRVGCGRLGVEAARLVLLTVTWRRRVEGGGRRWRERADEASFRRDGGGMRVESRVGKVWGSGGKGGEGVADGKGASEREGLRLTAHGGFADQVEVRGLGEDGRRDGDRAGSSGSLWRDSKADMMQRSWQCVGCTCDSGETGCNTDERPQLPGSSCAQWHLGDERTARRRRTEVQGIGARERKEDNETAEHRLDNTRGRGATSFSVFAPFLAGGKHGSTPNQGCQPLSFVLPLLLAER